MVSCFKTDSKTDHMFWFLPDFIFISFTRDRLIENLHLPAFFYIIIYFIFFLKACYSLCLHPLTTLAIAMLVPCQLGACTTTLGMHCIDCWVQIPKKGTRSFMVSGVLKGIANGWYMGKPSSFVFDFSWCPSKGMYHNTSYRWKSIRLPSWWIL